MSQRSYGGGARKPCANPLFEQWLTEWREEAAQKNSKMQYVYGKALSSLRKYPLHLANGRECLILEFFGAGLAKMIDKRMQQENIDADSSQGVTTELLDSTGGDPYNKPTKKRQKKKPEKERDDHEVVTLNEDDDSPEPSETTKKKRPGRAYIPGYRSGAYALLVAIGLRETKAGYRGYMTKTELVAEAQAHCDASMQRPGNPGGNYTSWNSMKTLVNKGLVVKQGNPTQYMLSPEGRELTNKLLQADYSKSLPVIDEDTDPDSSQSSTATDVLNNSANFYRTRLEPGQFEVVLYVDTSETSAKCKKDEVIGELRKNGVAMEVVRLSVGDFVWVCREVVQPGKSNKRLTVSRSAELILPYVVERKRSDDLAHSIKDGRFHEQKFRLRQTGLQAIYLHEEYGKGDYGLQPGALQQALANTQMTDEFIIQETSNIKDTCAYLTHMTRQLKTIYESKKISSCTKKEWETYKNRATTSETYLMIFSDFKDFAIKTKNWTVTEMFARHLMRLRGLSVERAYAIVQKYPTVTHLLRAYRDCSTDKERESLISSIYFGNSGRTIGPTIGRNIFQLYCSKQLS